MLMYTADLKRPLGEPLAQKRQAVETLLDKLALQGCRDVRIGSTLARGISGGEAKRTNIGIALITNPKVLFLDEPTSGLDSYMANEVMDVVKSLTSTDVTIVSTIHNPTTHAFSLFDELLMLIHGHVAYFGPCGTPLVDYMQQYLPLDILQVKRGMLDQRGQAEVLAQAYEQSPLKQTAEQKTRALSSLSAAATCSHSSSMQDVEQQQDQQQLQQPGMRSSVLGSSLPAALSSGSHGIVTPWWWGLRTLVKYRTTHLYKDSSFLGPRVMGPLFNTLVMMTLYLGIGDKFYPQHYTNMAAVLNLYTTMPAFGAVAIVPSVVLGFAIFVGALSPNLDVANILVPTYVTTLLFCGGFVMTYDAMPPWWKWYSYTNFLRYSWIAMMLNQFSAHDPVWVDGRTVLQFYGIAGGSAWDNLGYTVLFFVFWVTAAWVTLATRRYQQR
eukprot:jgi/Chrzof1/12053/Cz06g19180.t1